MSDENDNLPTDEVDMPDDSHAAYAALEGVNWSTLAEMRRSPLHYKYRVEHPQADKPVLAMGRADHCAVLQPEKFSRDFVIYAGKRKAGNAWKDFKEKSAGKTILTVAQYDKAMRTAEVVRSHSVAGPYLECGMAEQTVQWIDPITGLPCKSRLDFVSAAFGGCIAELKTSRDCEPRIFSSTVARLGYHCQVSHQKAGWAAKEQDLPVVVIAVEKVAPYDVIVWEMGEETLRVGRAEVDRLLELVRQCTEANHWPGRFSERQTLQLPTWLLGESEDAPKITFGEEAIL